MQAQQHERLRNSTSRGRSLSAGHSTPYLIRHLPVSSFPELPAAIADLLNRRGCLIPQTYEAHQPENVVHASLERAGSSDWAVFARSEGTVSLLVFFGSRHAGAGRWCWLLRRRPSACRPTTRAAFWASTGASIPHRRSRFTQAQTGMEHRPPRVDHDALADSIVDGRTVYHFYAKNLDVLEMPE